MSTAPTTSTTPPSSANPVPTLDSDDLISPRDAFVAIASGDSVLIDVREPDEFARERIAGAVSLPLSRFRAETARSLAPRSDRMILHCKAGRRSLEAMRLMRDALGDSARVRSMQGGLDGWKAECLPTIVNDRAPRMSIMRQVQLIVGVMVLAGSALAWLVHPGFIIVPAFFGAGLAFAGATGTCALASVLTLMPWNRGARPAAACAGGSCA